MAVAIDDGSLDARLRLLGLTLLSQQPDFYPTAPAPAPPAGSSGGGSKTGAIVGGVVGGVVGGIALAGKPFADNALLSALLLAAAGLMIMQRCGKGRS